MQDPTALTPEEFKKKYGYIPTRENFSNISLTPEQFVSRYGYVPFGVGSDLIQAPPSYDDSPLASAKRMAAGPINLLANVPTGLQATFDLINPAANKFVGLFDPELEKELQAKNEAGRETARRIRESAKRFTEETLGARPGTPVNLKTIGKEKTLAGKAYLIGRGTAEAVPTTLTYIGLRLLNAPLALATMFLSETGDTEAAFQDLEKEGVKISPEYRKIAPVAAGAFKSALEKFGLDNIEKISKVPGAKGKILQTFASFLSEGGTEGLQKVTDVIAQAGGKASKQDVAKALQTFKEEIQKARPQIEEAAIVGGFSGGTIGGGVAVGSEISSKRARSKAQQEILESIATKYGAKSFESLPQNTKEAIIAELQKAQNKSTEQKEDNATREQVAQQAFGKKFDDLTDEQKQKIVDKAAEAKTADEDARIDETLQGGPESEAGLEEISQKVYGKSFGELPSNQRKTLQQRYKTLADKAQAKKVDEAIAEKVGLKKPKAEKPEKAKAQPPVAEAAATASTAAERTAPAAEPVAFKPEVVTPKSESSPSQQAVAPSPVSARAGEGPQPSKTTVVDKPIADIATDVDRFQNRATEFSEKTAATVAERYDPNLFDPIVLWKDPQNGKEYVLSGHSRLEGMKRRGEKNIPSRYFQGTEAEAMNFAKVEANRLGSAENLQETIKAYKQAKRGNATKSKLKDLFDGDVDFLESAQNLNESGDFIRYLGQGAATEFPYIKRFSRWVGELRKTHGDKLTDRHEQQVFDWLYKGEKRNREIEKDRFFELVEKQVSRTDFNPNAPLLLKRGEAQKIGTRGRADTAKLENELDQLRADKKNARTPAEAQVIEKEIARVESAIKTLVKTQPDLFGEAEARPAPKETITPTHKEFDRAFETFQEVAAKQTGKPVPEQSAAIAEELRARNVPPVIIDELTNPRRALKPRNTESDRSATSRPERIARAAKPSPALKPKVDAVAQANVDFRNKEAALLKAREEIKADIEARGGEVVVDTETGSMTITLRPGKAKISDADQALIEKLRAEAAEAGAYSLATVGQGFEVSATPERIADAGDFKARALEFLRRNAEAKAAEKVFKQAKEDARNDLVDYYLAERVAGKETPSALLGVAKDGTKVEVMARRVRSAVEPDLAVGGRDFPKEIAEAKKQANERATKTGEPFIESRKASERQVSRAQLRGMFISSRDIQNETEHESGAVVAEEPLVVRESESKYNARPVKVPPNKFTVDVPLISLDDFKGKKVFIFAADRMRVGEYTGLDKNSGIKIKLQGGPLFPFIKQNYGKSGWAFSNKNAVNRVANRISNSDGIGLVMLQGESGVKGSKTFLEILFAEIQHGLNKKDYSQKEFLRLIDEARKRTIAQFEKVKDDEFKGTDDLKKLHRTPRSLSEVKQLLADTTFQLRSSLIDFFGSKTNVKEYGIPDINLIISEVNDPIFKGMEYGDIVSAVQFDKNPKIGTAKELGSQEHFSYGIQISGKGLGLFKTPYDVRDILKIEKPKLHAARSAFLRQPVQKVEKVKRGAFVAESQRKYGREDVDYDSWYSDWVKSIARTTSRKDIEKQLKKVAGSIPKAADSSLRAIEKSTSMQSNSQRRAQTGNFISGAGDRAIALRGALEIYDLFPEKTLDGRLKKQAEETAYNRASQKAADDWLDSVWKGIKALEEKHAKLLGNAQLYDRFKRGVNEGQLSKQRFKELQQEGKLISEDDYARALEVRREIEAIRNTDLVVPEKPASLKEQSEGYQPNRPGDFFTNPDAVFEQKPYEPNYKKRPDSTPRTDRLAKEAVEAIGNNRRRGRVYLANAIDASARETGTVTLVGQTIRTSDDLAVLAQVYRDPRWETLRYVFVKDGKVVNVTGISNRLPSAASAYPFASREDGLKWLKGLMDKTGADGYYLLHNHPSGVSKPSQADIEMTVLIASKVPGFKEHVVIDSNEFSVLSITETTNKETTVLRKTVPKNFGEDRLLKPSIDHPLIGRVIASPDDVLTVAKGLEAKDGWVTLISTSQGRVRGIMQVEEPLMKIPGKRRSAIIRNFARQTGGADTFAVVSDDFMRGHGKALSLAVERGFIRDAVTMRGYSITDMSAVKPNREFSFGKIIKSGRVVKEGEAKQEIPDTITVDGKELPTRNSKGQLIHTTQKGIENFWKWFGDSKVVDEQGRPLVVYHARNSFEFEIFSVKSDGVGFHFGSAEQANDRIAFKKETSGISSEGIFPVYLSIKNPIRITDTDWSDIGADARAVYEITKTEKFSIADVVLKTNAELIADIKSKGYDGIVYKNEAESSSGKPESIEKRFKTAKDSFISFEPNQIKSAIGNRGTFSPEEPSIVRESESTYGKAGLNRDQFLDLGKMVNDFLQSKEQVAKLSKAEREEFALILDVLKDYKELSEKADLSPSEKVLLKYAIRDIESPEGKRVIEKVQAALRENKPIEAGWLDKIAEWTASMYLWRLASVGSSIGSNLFRQLLKYPELKLAAWFNQGVARQTRVERTRFSEEAEKDFRDAWTGEEFKKAARKALDIMQEKPDAAEESKFFEREKIKRRAIPGKPGKIIRAGLNAQAAIDVLFRQPATTAAIARHSFREAAKTSKNRVEQAKKANAIAQNVRRLKALKDAKQEVPEYLEKFEPILEKAEADAEAQTFQSELEGFLKHVSEIRRYPLARIFVPFFNTRMNVLLQAYARTPFSAFGSEFRDLGAKYLNKSLTAEEAGRLSDRMAEITLGTAAFLVTTAALYGLSDDDEELITGDFDEKTIGEKPAGWLPNAVRVGDTFVSLKGFEPYATIFTAFGNAASGKKSIPRNAAEALAKAAFSNPMTDELFDIMGSLKDGDADKFFVDMVAGAATPGLLQDISKIADPTVRQKEGLEERFKSKVGIPGASTGLLPRIDVFGEELAPQTSGERALKAVTGVSISKSKEDAARREIRKLGLKHSLDAITHKGVELEPWEVLYLNQSIGKQYHETVLKLLQNPTYLAADNEARKDKLRSVRRKLIDDQKKILERSPYFMARERMASAQKKARERVKEQLAE